jgi:hypothetical protein
VIDKQDKFYIVERKDIISMKSILTLVLLLPTLVLWGQKEILHQQQIWYKYSLKVPVGDKWQILQELDDRNFINPARQSQFLTRTHLQRKLGGGWDIALGFAFFIHSLPQEPEVEDYTNYGELRPSFEITNLQKISEKFHLHHRYWTELRYLQQPDDTYTFGTVRVRYKIELGYELSEKFSFLAFDEILLNLGSKVTYNVFDQNRYGVAAMYSPVKNIGFELMYINWFQQTTAGDLFYDRDILRIALHHTLNVFRDDK